MDTEMTLTKLPKILVREAGIPGIGVCIWRHDHSVDIAFKGTVGEFLSKEENQSGEWLIDGGWGSPPGPIKVRWEIDHWANFGFWPWDGSKVFLRSMAGIGIKTKEAAGGL